MSSATRRPRSGGPLPRQLVTPYRMDTIPFPNRCSSSSSSDSPTPSGRDRVPPPTTTGATIRRYSSTRPARSARGRETGTAHAQVALGRVLHPPDGVGVEVALDPRPCARHRLQRARVDDLVGHLPDVRVVAHVRGQVGERERRFPEHHHLVHPPPVQVRADRPFEVVDECVDLGVGRRPVQGAVLVRDVPVERRDHRVDQPGHRELPSPRPRAWPERHRVRDGMTG